MIVAVIDLGTNTCNLLVADLAGGGFQILHQSKELVKLGDDKIKANEISGEAITRTLDAFYIQKKIIETYHADKVKVIATSAVRSADNKIDFLEKIGEETGWAVKVVSGEKEAELIFKGVLLAFKNLNQPTLILDIGGGSNELIFAHNNSLLWKESQPTGMARVINRFSLSDPVQRKEEKMLEHFFQKAHQKAIDNCRAKNIKTLLGCSGAFDTIADLIDGTNPGEKQRTAQNISVNDFNAVYDRLIISTRNERLLMKGMDYVRVELIVPAVIFIKQIISEIGIKQIIQTDFALREGVLYELIHRN